MRERLQTVLFIFAVTLVFFSQTDIASADIKTFSNPDLYGGYGFFPIGSLCSIPIDGGTVYAYSGLSLPCSLPTGSIIKQRQGAIGNDLVSTGTPLTIQTDRLPYVTSFGTTRKNGLSWSLEMSTRERSNQPTNPSLSLTINDISICADSLSLSFTNYTSAPNKLFSTHSNRFIDYAETSGLTGFEIHYSRHDDCASAMGHSSNNFQGYIQHGSSTLSYEYPLYCSNLRATISNSYDGDDWEDMNGVNIPLTQIAGEDTYILQRKSGDNGKNSFMITADYDGQTLHGYQVELHDATSNAGGIRYALLCDPINIDQNEDLCLDEGGSFDSTHGCCQQEGQESPQGAICTDEAISCVNEETAGGLCWSQLATQTCGGGAGEQLTTDTDYCCTSETIGPHPSQPVVCTDDGLDDSYSYEQYRYIQDQWYECSETSIGTQNTIVDNFVCSNHTLTFDWYESTCQDDGTGCGQLADTEFYRAPINAWTTDPETEGACRAADRVGGTCCIEGRYLHGDTLSPDSTGPEIKGACIDGNKMYSLESGYSTGILSITLQAYIGGITS